MYNTIANNTHTKSSYTCVFKKFSDIFSKTRIGDPCEAVESLYVDTHTLPDIKSKITTTEIKVTFAQKIHEYLANGFDVFAADASILANSVGCGIWHQNKKQSFGFKIEYRTSSAFGELWALLKTLDVAHQARAEKIVIFSDSQTACKLLKNNYSNNHCIALFHAKLLEFEFSNVHVVWSPGHSGIPINEKADQIAKEAADNGTVIEVEYTVEEALRMIRSSIFLEWYDGFLSYASDRPNLFAQIFTKLPAKTCFKSCKFNVKEIKLINRILVGHTYDANYLHKIHAIDSRLCECGEVNSYTHQVFHCVRLNPIRSKYKLFDNYKDFKSVLSHTNEKYTVNLLAFIKEAKIDF